MKQETNFGIFNQPWEKKSLLELVLYGAVYPGSAGIPWPGKHSVNGTDLLIICPVSANHKLSRAVGEPTASTIQVRKYQIAELILQIQTVSVAFGKAGKASEQGVLVMSRAGLRHVLAWLRESLGGERLKVTFLRWE